MNLFSAASAGLPGRTRPARALLSAIAGLAAIAILTGCTTTQEVKQSAPPPVIAKPGPVSMQPLSAGQPNYYRLPGMAKDATPVRVGVILPFSNGSPATRKLAASMMNAAEMALYDSGNRNILLMAGDEGGGGAEAADAARDLIAKGAEVIIGPLFSGSVRAAAPIARAKGIPLIAFSTDRAAGGNGVYLLSFQPENELRRVVSYASAQGRRAFAALVPQNAYGDHIAAAFRKDVPAAGGRVVDIERFDPASGDISLQVKSLVTAHPDALFVAQGGPQLRVIAATLTANNLGNGKVQLLGPGLWDDRAAQNEPALAGGWFAAPRPAAEDGFAARYQQTFGERPAQLASLSYDAVALVALLSGSGPDFHRFTDAAILDPNGFSGVTGIFRFEPDGACERGLSVLGVGPDGFRTVSPAPSTFQKQGS